MDVDSSLASTTPIDDGSITWAYELQYRANDCFEDADPINQAVFGCLLASSMVPTFTTFEPLAEQYRAGAFHNNDLASGQERHVALPPQRSPESPSYCANLKSGSKVRIFLSYVAIPVISNISEQRFPPQPRYDGGCRAARRT
jgi:hypothetical protein